MRAAGLLLMPALVIGAVYALHMLVALREAESQRRRRSILATAARALDTAIVDGTIAVTGFVRGRATTFTVHGDTGHVEVEVPPTELLLSVQPRLVPARCLLEPGLVRTGDTTFDEALYAEGAPADVVRCLLGPELRARLLAAQPLELSVRGSAVELIGPVAAPHDAPPLIDLAAAIAAALPAAVAEADRRLTEVTGSPYRPEPDATAVRAAHAGRREEVGALLELMQERASAARRALLLALVLGMILVISLYASGP